MRLDLSKSFIALLQLAQYINACCHDPFANKESLQKHQDGIADCPTLFHMAERYSWPSIRERGLLSTSALLDLYRISGDHRTAIESMRRPESVTLQAEGLPSAVVRDQIPMTDNRLRQCLPAHLSPQDWYEILNAKVFFWLTRDRLHRFIGGRTYRDKSHDVLELDTRSLIEAHRDRIWLCPMNSGNTFPFAHPRDESTFSRIADYSYSAWRKKGREGNELSNLQWIIQSQICTSM